MVCIIGKVMLHPRQSGSWLGVLAIGVSIMIMVEPVGLEPTTYRLKADYSTIEL